MNKKMIYLVIGIILLSTIAFQVSAEVYGNKTCTLEELFPGMPVYICKNPDGGMDHSFFTYAAMNSYYVPPLNETFVPQTTYVYGAGTQTFTP